MKQPIVQIIEYFDTLINQVDIHYELENGGSGDATATASSAPTTPAKEDEAEPKQQQHRTPKKDTRNGNSAASSPEFTLAIRMRIINELRRMQEERVAHYKQSAEKIEREMARLRKQVPVVAVAANGASHDEEEDDDEEEDTVAETEVLRKLIYADRFAFLLPLKKRYMDAGHRIGLVLVKTDFYLNEDSVRDVAKLVNSHRGTGEKALDEISCAVFDEVIIGLLWMV